MRAIKRIAHALTARYKQFPCGGRRRRAASSSFRTLLSEDGAGGDDGTYWYERPTKFSLAHKHDMTLLL